MTRLERGQGSNTFMRLTPPIATFGEVFNGSMIELIRDVSTEGLQLLLWNGAMETKGSIVEYRGRSYVPSTMDLSLLRELTLPTRSCSHGTTCQLLTDICKLFAEFIILSDNYVSLLGRFVLTSWLIEAVQTAPALAITGPYTSKGNQLLDLLHCLCRHPLRMTGVTSGGICSLPTGARFTLLISQATVSDKLRRLLDDASRRDQKIPHRGGLLDLYGCQAIYSESVLDGGPWSCRFIQIPVLPADQRLAPLSATKQHGIAADFQPKLLSFRCENLGRTSGVNFDASHLTYSLRPVAQSLAAATPDDPKLQAEVLDLLQAEDTQLRGAKWLDFDTIVIESVLFACAESSGGVIYVGELAESAREIWRRRGKYAEVDPGTFGKRIKLLGFATGPRDAKGIKLPLTEAVCLRAHQLARDFGVPEAGGGEVVAPPRKSDRQNLFKKRP